MASPLLIADFIRRFKFFEDADPEQVQAALDEAHASYDGCSSAPQYHGIVGNHAAHLLVSEPGGHTMRLNKTDDTTTYSAKRDALLKQIPRSGVVIA